MRKPYYEIQGEPQKRDYETTVVMKLGTIVHEMITLDKDTNEMSLAGNIRNMTYLDPKKINIINFYDCISGKVDDIVKINGNLVIVDKKTYSSIPKKSALDPDAKVYSKYEKREVDEDYVFQLNEYMLLYYLKTGVKIDKGALIYLDTANRFARPKVFEICLMSIEEIKNKVIEKLDILRKAKETGEPPEGVPTWRCEYMCPFKDICPIPKLPNYLELIGR